jgi:competence protein ComEA
VADDDGNERAGRRALFHSPLFFHRAVLLICAIAISVPVIYKSRPGRVNSSRAAFIAPSSVRGYVRISGDVRHAGMYPISANTMTIDVIKMAGPVSSSMKSLSGVDDLAHLESGMALHVTVSPQGAMLMTKNMMTANERLVMGVPLDINVMSESDFDRLPGIGPKMARRIVEYRQNNGGIMKVTDLLLIDGIGEKKYNQLLKFFNCL